MSDLALALLVTGTVIGIGLIITVFAVKYLEPQSGASHWRDYAKNLEKRIEEGLYCTPEEYARIIRESKADAIEELKFPVMLRKMWSSGEVQDWLKEQANKLREGEDE